jgi:hypothetical protein
MDRQAWSSALLGALLLLPAAALIGSALADGAFGTHLQPVVMSAFERLGVTNASPLGLRRLWFAGVFLIAPFAAVALNVRGGFGRGRAERLPMAAVAASGLLIGGFAVVHSLADR